MKPKELLSLAVEAMGHAYVPYSGYCVGAALLCAGGLGNVLERLWRGCVTDYIRFPRLPAGRLQRLVWNLADLMLSAGALLLAAGSISS